MHKRLMPGMLAKEIYNKLHSIYILYILCVLDLKHILYCSEREDSRGLPQGLWARERTV
jgi:hypothetical protein